MNPAELPDRYIYTKYEGTTAHLYYIDLDEDATGTHIYVGSYNIEEFDNIANEVDFGEHIRPE